MTMVGAAAAVSRARRRPTAASGRRHIGGGIAWIVALGALLAGVVAVNVLVLELNMSLDRLGTERAQLKADNARLRAQLSTASATIQITTQARSKLGLQPADPLLTEYVRINPGNK